MKTSEMIAMLEKNPKLKFKKASWQDGTMIGIEKHPQRVCMEIQVFGNFYYDSSKYQYACEYLAQGWDDWEIVEPLFPAWKAIRELQNGGTVVWKLGAEEMVFRPDGAWFITKTNIDFGKWYIKEGE